MYTKIFHCKPLQNLPKLGFLVGKQPSGNPVKNLINETKNLIGGINGVSM
jgi:hypothetical protein